MTVRNKHPLSLADDLLDKLQGASVFRLCSLAIIKYASLSWAPVRRNEQAWSCSFCLELSFSTSLGSPYSMVVNMSLRQGPSQRQRSFKLRQRRERTFFEATERCAENQRLTVRPVFTYSPPVVAVCFGHLYKGEQDQRAVEGLVWKSILAQLPHQLIAMDPQRLGTPTAAYGLHFQEESRQRKHDLIDFLTVKYSGKREQLPASSKGSQISPRYAEVVVKQLDPRWARKGVTAALLKAAGYSAHVAVKTAFVGDLPTHLSCWSDHLGRSDVTVAKGADPSLRKLPRSLESTQAG